MSVSLLSPFIRPETDVQLEGVLFSESTHQRNLPYHCYHIEFSEQKVSLVSLSWLKYDVTCIVFSKTWVLEVA